MNRNKIQLTGIALLILGLEACGGGGGNNNSGPIPPTSPPAAQYPLDSAISAFMQMQHGYTTPLGENNGEQALLVNGYSPGPEQSFQGQSAFTTTNSSVVLVGGNAGGNNESRTDFFLIGPFEFLGNVDTDGQMTIASNQVPLPDLATVGQSGALDTVTIYTDSTLTNVYGTETDTWTLQAVTSDTASLCVNRGSTSSTCLTIDTNGDVLAMNIQNGIGFLF